jgi:DNA-binding SARP family transcriptional activator
MGGLFFLRFLGTVQVEREGEPVHGFRSRKALALLGYLAAAGRGPVGAPVPRERPVDLFWEDKPEARGRSNLSWVLGRISTLLPGCLQAERHTVQFRRAAPYWLDVDAFEELEALGNAAALPSAVELYGESFWKGCTWRGGGEKELLVRAGERLDRQCRIWYTCRETLSLNRLFPKNRPFLVLRDDRRAI